MEKIKNEPEDKGNYQKRQILVRGPNFNKIRPATQR